MGRNPLANLPFIYTSANPVSALDAGVISKMIFCSSSANLNWNELDPVTFQPLGVLSSIDPD